MADYDSRTPLQLAVAGGHNKLHLTAAGGHNDLVLLLLLEGADVNAVDNFGTTPLLEALRAGHDEAAAILASKGGTVGLQVCAWGGSLESCCSLPAAHRRHQRPPARRPPSAPIRTCVSHSRLSLLSCLSLLSLFSPLSIFTHPQEPGPVLCAAVAAADTDLLQHVLSDGVHPSASDYDQRSPLHIAATKGHLHVARLLVDHHADVAACDSPTVSPSPSAVRQLLREVGAGEAAGGLEDGGEESGGELVVGRERGGVVEGLSRDRS
ncbi:unnamed protein product [Closterium sp. Naga37s-1]|nr:unnamed protein product [Closterium sp. Naga37s-1]